MADVVCDIEIYPNFFCAGFKRVSDGKVLYFELSERQPVLDVVKLERVLRTNRIITFNGLNYDMPLLWLALRGWSNKQLKAASDRIINRRLRYWEVGRVFDLVIPELDHIDMIEPQPNAIASLKLLQGRLYGKRMRDLPYEPDHVLAFDEMDEVAEYNINDLDATINLWMALQGPFELREALSEMYGVNLMNKSDSQIGETIVKVTTERKLNRKVKRAAVDENLRFKYEVPDYISFKSPVLQALLDDVRKCEFSLSKSSKGTLKVVLPPELDQRKIEIGSSVYQMGIGGLHSTEQHRTTVCQDGERMADVDVASFYPSIILKSGLFPKSLGKTFLEDYGAVRESRVKAKHEAARLKSVVKELNAEIARAGANRTQGDISSEIAECKKEIERLGLIDKSGKIQLNGCFGKLGSVYSLLYAPQLLIAVTITGQLALLMLIERMEAAGISVISGNTDGAVLHASDDLIGAISKGRIGDSIAGSIVEQWERETDFELEATEYAAMYNESVNSYIAVKPDGSAKRKGNYANYIAKGYEDMRGQLMHNPNHNVCADAVLDYILTGTSIEQHIYNETDIRNFVTVITAKGGATWCGEYLGKVVRYIWSTEGDVILKKSGAKVPRSEGCRPLMYLPNTLPDDIDYARYIKEAYYMLANLGVSGFNTKAKRKAKVLDPFNLNLKSRKWWIICA